MYIHKSEAHKYINPRRVEKEFSIFEINVLLLDTDPAVWRTIAVPSNFTLEQLGRAAACAIGWIKRYFNFFGTDGEFIKGFYPSYMMMQEEDEDEDNDDEDKEKGGPSKEKVKTNVAKNIIISSLLIDSKGEKKSVTMDYGNDGWLHEITLIKTREPDRKYYPKCIDGKNACPPEDCGGPDGYKDLLEAIRDRKHEDHQSMKEWLEDSGYKKFNPKKFSVSSVGFGD